MISNLKITLQKLILLGTRECYAPHDLLVLSSFVVLGGVGGG